MAQSSDYPMRLLDNNDFESIKLIGGDTKFVVFCFQSAFGTGIPEEDIEHEPMYGDGGGKRYWTRHTWKNIVDKSWSNGKCTLSITYSVGHHPYDGPYTEMNIPYMEIEILDSNGKSLLEYNSESRKAILKYIKAKLFHGFAIVNSSNGLNVRKKPSITAPVVHRLKDQSKVILLEQLDKPRRDSTGILWVKVFIDNKITGYVAGRYLLPWYSIHPKTLKDADYISLIDSLDNFFFSYSSRVKAEDYLPTWKDTLNKFLSIELVNHEDYINKKVSNLYALDTSYNDAPAPCNSGFLYPETPFYLKIDGGKKIIYFKEVPSEYPETRSYIGRIPIFNQYVFSSCSFDCGYPLYDMTTGEGKFQFGGIPYFSPDGKFVVDFIHQMDREIFDYPHTTMLSISNVDKYFKIKRKFNVQFTSWLPDGTPNSALWISNNEVIIRVISINSYFSYISFSDAEMKEGISYQYIKLKI